MNALKKTSIQVS